MKITKMNNPKKITEASGLFIINYLVKEKSGCLLYLSFKH